MFLDEHEKIFPSYLVSGSVKTQTDLDAAFLKYPTLSRSYIQTALYWKNLREWYEKYWPKVRKFLDSDFLNKFRMEEEHIARAWEFHLAAVFLDRGFQFVKKTSTYGPDFCIKLPLNKKIWIEAVMCDLGTVDPVPPKPILVPGVMYTETGNIEEEHRTRALRITNAIASKFEKYKGYLNDEKSGVKKDDYLIIAVNGQAIQHFSDPGMLFRRAIFGQGPDIYVMSNSEERLKGPFYKPVPTITKKSGITEQEIPANFMEMDEFSSISSVLYCGNWVGNSLDSYEPGDDFIFAYHSNPQNVIPVDTFKFGRGVQKNPETQQIFDYQQK